MDFRLNGHVMGQELAYVKKREVAVIVTGWDQVDRVELLKNNRVIHRDFPMDRVPYRSSWDRPVLVRVEYGWGPWAALGADRTADWDLHLSVDGGRLEAVQTCFQSGFTKIEDIKKAPPGCWRGFSILRRTKNDYGSVANASLVLVSRAVE